MKRLACLLPVLLGGCEGIQSAFAPGGAHTATFDSLLTLFLVVCGIFYALVIGFLAWAVLRKRREGGEAGVTAAFKVWVPLIAVCLIGLALASYLTDRAFAGYGTAGPAVHIRLTANQWWWNVEYAGAHPGDGIRTANEIHLPVGRPAVIELQSADVIHSFWVPNLAGKQDLIPGRTNDIALLPRRVGVYRGQCAEFCGAQHAHMAIDIVVEPEAQFRAWWTHQRAEAPAPRTPLQAAGLNYVTTRECAMCHQIAGTSASGQVAPDLTHLASRRSLAAGTLPMSRGSLYAWIADPQGVKPGNHMPYIGLAPRDLDAVVAYLETLK